MTETDQLSPLKRALLAIETLQDQLTHAHKKEPIAVIGVGCRFPGGSVDADTFWDLLMSGRTGVIDTPAGRWDVDAWYDPDRDTPGKMNIRRGGFLQEDIDQFDADFFGIAPREAIEMDPQQRLILEVAWQTLDNAACPASSLRDSNCGVFLGLYNNNYTLANRGSPAPERISGWSSSGTHTSIASGRLSYFLGLLGPSLTVDTACSSSLVAVHTAIRSLQRGECNIAFAGGVHLLLAPETLVASTKLGATSPDGVCKTFDAAADGFGHGEGCGLILLKPLSDAQNQGDRILAVIRGSAVNQDGRSNSLTAPSGVSQKQVITAALKDAGLDPALVNYVEAHGTGTQLGDPIEIEALIAALGDKRDSPLTIGSVKTNIGHLEAAAGIAGLIKAILSLQHEMIPPHLNLQQVNPEIDSGNIDLVFPQEPLHWETLSGRRVAGVSAFGFGGTNAHLILEQAPIGDLPKHENVNRVLPLSAKNGIALTELADSWSDWLETKAPEWADATLTAAQGRDHFSHRLAVVGKDSKSAAETLRHVAKQESNAVETKPSIAFLFTGQGCQFPGMAKRAYEVYPVFRETLDRCLLVLESVTGRSMSSLLFGEAPITDTSIAQPLVIAVELALVDLWKSWGIEPSAVMGHSLGEYAAAVTAGAMSQEDTLILVAERGRMMQSLASDGGMLAAFASVDSIDPILSKIPGTLSIAAINGPQNTVISGSLTALKELSARLSEQDILSKRLDVSHAFHSTLLDPVLPKLELAAEPFGERWTNLPLVSNLTGDIVQCVSACHWREHAAQPVLFEKGLRTLQKIGCDTFLEMGADCVLMPLGRRVLGGDQWIASLRRGSDDDEVLARAVGDLYTIGADIDWSALNKGSGGRKTGAPSYSFQRRPYWLDLPKVDSTQHSNAARDEQSFQQIKQSPAEGSSVIYDFYDELTLISSNDDLGQSSSNLEDHLEAEGHLTFGLFPDPVPDFSWIRALFDKQENPSHHDLLRTSQYALKAALFDGIDFSDIRRVFDYGCGHGADLCNLAVRYPQLKLQGYTLSAGQVEIGSKRIANLGLEDRVRIHRNDSSAVPFPDTFDLIFGFEVTGLVANKEGLFQNIAEHLAPGGLLVIADFVSTGDPISNPATNSFTPSHEQWVDLLSRQKLRVLRAIETSQEIANWLEDPKFKNNVDELVERFNLSELTRRHLLSNENIGKALRNHLMRYFMLTIQRSPYESEQAIRDHNDERLRNPIPYSEVQSTADHWRRWLYRVEWESAPTLSKLPSAKSLATTVSEAAHRESQKLQSYGDLGSLLDRLSLDYTVAAFRELGCDNVEQASHTAVAKPFLKLRDRLVTVMRSQGIVELPTPMDLDERCTQAFDRHPELEAELTLLRRCGGQLGQVLQGNCDPLQLLFPDGDAKLAENLYEQSPLSRTGQRLVAEVLKALPRTQPLSILEIGGGTGATTSHLLASLPEDSRYLFTEISGALLSRAKEKFADFSLDFEQLDISLSPQHQGFGEATWDIVVAANVLHATPDLSLTLKHVHDLLRPGGLLLILENTGRLNWGDLTFGLTEGMWNFTDTDLRDYALLYQDQWKTLLPRCGFEVPSILSIGKPDQGGVSQQCVLLARRSAKKHWLLVGERSHFTDAVSELLSEHGDMCSVCKRVSAEGDDQISPEITDIAFLCDTNETNTTQPKEFLTPALSLTQTLAQVDQPARLHFVTRGAQAFGDSVNPLQATMLGFGRTIMSELPEIQTRLIDLDPDVSPARQARELATELTIGSGAEIAWRDGVRRKPTLTPNNVDTLKPVQIDPLSSCLITGAFGSLGLQVAEWLADHGAKKLVMTGRHHPSPEVEQQLCDLESRGVEIVRQISDVGNRTQVENLLETAQEIGPLKIVVHSAGTLSDGVILRQNWEKFETVFQAKVRGSWNLHELTSDLNLDHFILFSSAASLLGPSGQANHAAANSFIDTLAHFRRQRGLPAVSINWGAWAEVGAAVQEGIKDRVEHSGLIHMAPQQALNAFHWALSEEAPSQVAVIDASWHEYLKRFDHSGPPPLLAGLNSIPSSVDTPPRRTLPREENTAPIHRTSWRIQLGNTPSLQRMDLLRSLVRATITEILRLSDDQTLADDRPLPDIGMDSLMSIELRNKLSQLLQTKLPATLIFDYPTLTRISEYISRQVIPDLFTSEEKTDGLDDLDAESLSKLLEAELGDEV